MKTVEEKAMEYQEREHSIWNGKGMAKELQKAYIAGAEAMRGRAFNVFLDGCEDILEFERELDIM